MPLLLGHAAVAGGGGSADLRSAAAQGLLGLGGKRTEAHAGDGDRDFDVDRLIGEAGAEPHIGRAFLAIAFERIAAHRGAEKQEVVEMRDLALGASAADVTEAGGAKRKVPHFDDLLFLGASMS